MSAESTRRVNKLIEKYGLPYKIGVRKSPDYGYETCLFAISNGRKVLIESCPGDRAYGPLIETLTRTGPAGQAVYAEFRSPNFII